MLGLYELSMSQHHIITDTEERKIEVGVERGGSVFIVKKWLDEEQKTWIIRELIINGDEWDRINEIREELKNK